MVRLTILLLILIFSMPNAAPLYRSESRSHPVIGKNGMVSTQEKHASEVGLQVLKEGGNAIDAAVAIGLTLAVTLPRAGNLGGGGFMMIYSAKTNKVYSIDYREKAPLSASRDMFLDESGMPSKEKSRNSILSTGVPGTLAGFELALEKFGTRKLSYLINPAIKYAKRGFIVSHDFSQSLEFSKTEFSKYPASKSIFLKKDGSTYKAGDRFYQKDLAKTLSIIKHKGVKAFYTGTISNKIISYMNKNNGLINKEDLQKYTAKMRAPIKGSYKGYDIYAMGPPSSGGVHLVQLMNILENLPLSKVSHNSADYIQYLVESMKFAYADRSVYLGDPDFETIPVEELISKKYAKSISKKISLKKIIKSSDIAPGNNQIPYESNETTHFTVVDKYGNVVTNTYTLNFSYGNKQVVPGTGILLNNEMDDFTSKVGYQNAYGLVGGPKNDIEPEKRMLSSMTPTMVFKDNKFILATGSPGGSRIITTVLQVILNIIEKNKNVSIATISPRIHHQWKPDIIFYEEGINADTIKRLKQKGYKIKQTAAMGSSHTILKNDTNYLEGSADPRKPDGIALGIH